MLHFSKDNNFQKIKTFPNLYPYSTLTSNNRLRDKSNQQCQELLNNIVPEITFEFLAIKSIQLTISTFIHIKATGS